jgi:hypothetical protein
MKAPQPSELVEVMQRHHYECFGDHCDDLTYVVRYKDLVPLLDDLIETMYADVDVPEDWPAFKPRPTAQALHDELMMADKWTSVPDYDSGYDDYYTLYISPFKVWEPTTQGEVK